MTVTYFALKDANRSSVYPPVMAVDELTLCEVVSFNERSLPHTVHPVTSSVRAMPNLRKIEIQIPV